MELVRQVKAQVGWIKFNRPEFHNAINKAMWEALPKALDELIKGGARVIVFAGEGRLFAAGADLAELMALDGSEQAAAYWQSLRGALNAVASCAVPTIAMVHGSCLGGGCLLACACDIRICEPAATFWIPTAQLGIVLDEDNILRLMNLVGRANTAEILMASSKISAARAQQMGLVNVVAESGALELTVQSMAQAIVDNAAEAVRRTKHALVALAAGNPADQDQTAVIASFISAEFKSRADGVRRREQEQN